MKPAWIEQVSLTNFVHVEYVHFEKIEIDISFKEIFTADFLAILVTLACVIYFLVATENRLTIIHENPLKQNPNFKIRSVFVKNH